MRTLLIIAIIAGFIFAIYYATMLAVARVSFQLGFKGLDLSGISLDTVFTGSGTIKVQVSAKIDNRNPFNINMSNFHVWIYYKGTMIAQTTPESNNLTKVSIPASGGIDVIHDVTVYLNSSFLQAAKDLKSGGARFDYKISFNVFGFPYSYSDYFNYSIGG